MGLDMYLSARKYVEKIDWQKMHQFDNLDFDSAVSLSKLPEFDTVVEAAGLSDVATDIYGASVSVTALYWRKVNAIHNWFVTNVQGGEDNCGEYYVSHEQLDELFNLCTEAYATKNPSLLEPVGGFFFGSTDIDEWYWHGIKNTIDGIKKIKKHKDYDRLSFYYSSSW
mgnify:CR=1 FL=1